MLKIKEHILPVIFLYLSLICLYVSYLFITKDYNTTKSIYQPYKTFVQISPFDHFNVIITLFKGVFGVIGFIKYVLNRKLINYFSTLFLMITVFEIIFYLYINVKNFKDFSIYIDFTSILFSGILFLGLGFLYFKNANVKQIFPQVVLALFLTVFSYYLH